MLVRPRVFLTELSGEQMEPRKLVRRRKALCKSWFNHQWLSRVLAVTAFLAGDGAEGVLLSPEGGPELRLDALPLAIESPVSLAPEDSTNEVEAADEEPDIREDPGTEDSDDAGDDDS